MTSRYLEPELLDHLDHRDPEAIRSRRELAFINGIMGNHRWLRREVRRVMTPTSRILELGAGDGGLGLELMQSGIIPPERFAALDLAPRPADWPIEATWHQRDLFDSAPWPEADIVLANLFLHHFDADALLQLGRRLQQHCRTLIVSEPARGQLHIVQGTLLAALADFGHVTRNDMLTSIRAGFTADELPALLAMKGWKFETRTTLLGAYRLVGRRSAS